MWRSTKNFDVSRKSTTTALTTLLRTIKAEIYTNRSCDYSHVPLSRLLLKCASWCCKRKVEQWSTENAWREVLSSRIEHEEISGSKT
jgi:hypothetical protein